MFEPRHGASLWSRPRKPLNEGSRPAGRDLRFASKGRQVEGGLSFVSFSLASKENEIGEEAAVYKPRGGRPSLVAKAMEDRQGPPLHSLLLTPYSLLPTAYCPRACASAPCALYRAHPGFTLPHRTVGAPDPSIPRLGIGQETASDQNRGDILTGNHQPVHTHTHL